MMPSIPGVDQGFSVKLDRDIEKLVRKMAEEEDRTIKVIIRRAVELYAKTQGRR